MTGKILSGKNFFSYWSGNLQEMAIFFLSRLIIHDLSKWTRAGFLTECLYFNSILFQLYLGTAFDVIYNKYWWWIIIFHAESSHSDSNVHSQKQSAHWAVDVTAQVVPCWLGSWLNCNLWLVLGQWNQLAFQLIQLDITGVHCLNAPDSGVSSWVNIKSPGSASFEHLNLPCI